MSNILIEKLASRIHEIADADPRVQAWWGGAGSSPELLRAYAGLALVRGTDTTLEEVHIVWAVAAVTANPDNQYLRHLRKIPVDVQDYDLPYRDAIRAAAKELGELT